MNRRVSRLSLVLLSVVPILNLTSCNRGQPEGDKVPKSAAPTVDSKTVRQDKAPLSDRERFDQVMRQKLPMRQKMKSYAEDAARMLREDDREGFLKLAGFFENSMGQKEFGIELGKALDPDGREKVIGWLEEIPDPKTRHRATSGVLAWALAMDTSNALQLMGKLPLSLLALTEPPLNSYSLEQTMWVVAGSLVVSDAPADKDRSSLLAALSSKPALMKSYAAGIADDARKAISGSRTTSFGPIFGEIPEEVRAEVLNELIGGLEAVTVEKSAALPEILHAMRTTKTLDESTYLRLGKLLEFKMFDMVSSQITGAPTSANFSLVKGWASQSPAKAVESLTASRPEYVPAAFSAWVEADSIEASKWLGSQRDGQIGTDCTVELCKYLITSGASEQAAGWMARLPEERRQEIEKMMQK